MTDSNKKSEHCCSMEMQRLKETIYQCDYCTTSLKAHHRCLRRAARESGKRSRACILS